VARQPITERWLAGKLRPSKIASSNIRIGAEQDKGYGLADFKEAFDRYLSARGILSVPPSQNLISHK
jgi:Protein of unknown function (DUF3631)